MRAMILAAGRGERMRPLTDHTPKPLLPVAGKPLIVWHIERLVRAGLRDIVINHAWLGERIEAALSDGRRWGARIRYSPEPVALETAGGIAQALPMLGGLGGEPFLVVNGDVWCDWEVALARRLTARLDGHQNKAWLLMVDNPSHHPSGDFTLQGERLHDTLEAADALRLTFSGLGVYHPSLFAEVTPGTPAPLAPLLRRAMSCGAVLGCRYRGNWMDVGTPLRLKQLERMLHALPGSAQSTQRIYE